MNFSAIEADIKVYDDKIKKRMDGIHRSELFLVRLIKKESDAYTKALETRKLLETLEDNCTVYQRETEETKRQINSSYLSLQAESMRKAELVIMLRDAIANSS